jgi:hypothetical protein
MLSEPNRKIALYTLRRITRPDWSGPLLFDFRNGEQPLGAFAHEELCAP